MKRRAYLSTFGAAILAGCTKVTSSAGDSSSSGTDSEQLIPYESDASGEFRHRRANTQHTGHVLGSRVPDNPDVKWRVELDDAGAISPAVTEKWALTTGKLISLSSNSTVRDSGAWFPLIDDAAIAADSLGNEVHLTDIETGEILQTFSGEGGYQNDVKAVEGERDQFFILRKKYLRSFTREGSVYKESWSVELADDAAGMLTVTDSYVLSPRGNGFIAAFDRKDGAKAWEHEVEGGKSAAYKDGTALLSGKTSMLVDVESGDVEWTEDRRLIPPVSAGIDHLSVTWTHVSMKAFDGDNNELWNADVDLNHAPVLADGVVVAPVGQTVVGFDAATGERAWTFETEDRVGVSVANDVVYVTSAEDAFFALA